MLRQPIKRRVEKIPADLNAFLVTVLRNSQFHFRHTGDEECNRGQDRTFDPERPQRMALNHADPHKN